jgi:hypothetical protein
MGAGHPTGAGRGDRHPSLEYFPEAQSGETVFGDASMSTAVLFPHMDQTVLCAEFFLLQGMHRGVVHRLYAQIRIAQFAVEFLVALKKAAEFGVALHQRLYLVFLLVLEHQQSSWQKTTRDETRRAIPAAARGSRKGTNRYRRAWRHRARSPRNVARRQYLRSR